ncbi:GNAT family N-acetyltransferase [Paenibacillus ferrarius]|nr:GNAT family N-acetyltransferase [Paenibacillus ferrarius]
MKIRNAVLEDVDGIVKVHIDSLKTSHIGILPSDFLDNLTHEWSSPRFTEALSKPLKDASLYIAENENGKIVGFIWGGAERNGDDVYQGEIYAIYVLNEYQGAGIGRQLVEALVEDLLRHHIRSMLVMVFAENISSRRFYEAMGGRKIREGTVTVKGEVYKDVVYGWTNIENISHKLK